MRDTIKNHKDFHTDEDAPSARTAFFIVRAKPAKFPSDPRVGFMVTKRTFKLAVHRNRAKRMLRDWARFCSDLMSPEYDYIFFAYASILGASREEGRVAMARALQHILRKYGGKKSQNLAKNP